MPVIINDFEIVAAPPQQPQEAAAPRRPPAEETPPPLRPQDVERILRHFVERRLRLWAD